ncbi:MAG: putative lipid II flippase FtsW [bacterium]|nr:putative lipid II flippase FtsW [bacterium]
MPRTMAYDRWLFLTASLLAVGGLLIVGSASNYQSLEFDQGASALYLKHLGHLALGFVGLMAALTIPYRALADRRLVLLLLAIFLVLLIFVLAMPPIAGARRWIPIGPLNFQPSEFAKLVTVVFMASLLSRKEEQVNEPWVVPLPCLVVIATLSFLVIIEPDLGSAVILATVAGVMVFVAGLRWRYVAITAGMAGVAFVGAIISEGYRVRRVLTFFNPDADVFGSGWQLKQSLIAIGNGGLTGEGLGGGQAKALFLPAVHTDFIFSLIGEEFGLIGTMTLLLAFMLVFWRGLRAAVRAPDRFGFYLALGLTLMLVLQALVNMCVCLGLLPTKGLPLPLISYGGSSLLVSMMAMGLLINVSQHSN